MINPDHHENAAMAALTEGSTADATVEAILALASAIDRLAKATEDATLERIEQRTPSKRSRW